MDHGADAFALTPEGLNILNLCILHEKTSNVEKILGFFKKSHIKELVNHKTNDLLLPIHYAAIIGNFEAFKTIFKYYDKNLHEVIFFFI